MNVLFPFVGDSVGGSHWSAINLFKELQARENINPTIVLHIADGMLSKHLDSLEIPYDVVPLNNFAGQNPNLIYVTFLMFYNASLIIKYIKRNNIDIVHGNDLRINLTWSLPVKLSTAKYIWHQRTILSSSIKWRAVRYISNFVVSISSFVHNSLPNNLQHDSCMCVRNPFDTKTIYDKTKSRESLNIKYPSLRNAFLFGYVGRLVPWKHVENILFSLEKIINHSANTFKVHLIIVGSGDVHYTRKINNLISSLKIEKYVTMTGFYSNPSLIISAIDLLISPSHNEPFGRVIIESMIQKTPVLAYRSGGHIESIEHNNNGLLYDESTYDDSLLGYMLQVLSKEIDINSISDNAYRKATIEYSSSKHADTMISIYNMLI